jgi:hypothetical protein
MDSEERRLPEARSGSALWAWLPPLLAWLVSVSWRPFYLGLYHDDWSLFQRGGFWEVFRPLIASLPSRPGEAFIFALGGAAFGCEPWAWQAVAAVLTLLAALCLSRFARSLYARALGAGRQAAMGAGFCATLWLVFPWGLAGTAWPCAACVNLLSLIGFTCSGCILLDAAPGWRRSLGAALVFGLSGAFYEAFWGAPLLLVGALCLLPGGRKGRARDMACMLAAQLCLLGFNRWAAGIDGAVTKTFNTAILQGLQWNLRDLRRIVEHFSPFAPAAFLALAGLAIPFPGPAWRKAGRGTLVLLALAAAGILCSSALLASAGYGVAADGLESRTLLVDNVWIAVALGTLAALCRPGAWTFSCAFVVAAILGLAQGRALGDWRASWLSQGRVLAAFPWAAVEALPPQSVVLADLPALGGSVPDFAACWDLAGAVRSHMLGNRAYSDLEPKGLAVTVLRRWDWVSRWDGSGLVQRNRNGFLNWRLPASHAFLWTYPAPGLRALPPGWNSDGKP